MPNEKINHPKHYNVGKIEVIEFINDQQLNFQLGNSVKYICRAKHKGSELEDLKKAKWYVNYEIKLLLPLELICAMCKDEIGSNAIKCDMCYGHIVAEREKF